MSIFPLKSYNFSTLWLQYTIFFYIFSIINQHKMLCFFLKCNYYILCPHQKAKEKSKNFFVSWYLLVSRNSKFLCQNRVMSVLKIFLSDTDKNYDKKYLFRDFLILSKSLKIWLFVNLMIWIPDFHILIVLIWS